MPKKKRHEPSVAAFLLPFAVTRSLLYSPKSHRYQCAQTAPCEAVDCVRTFKRHARLGGGRAGARRLGKENGNPAGAEQDAISARRSGPPPFVPLRAAFRRCRCSLALPAAVSFPLPLHTYLFRAFVRWSSLLPLTHRCICRFHRRSARRLQTHAALRSVPRVAGRAILSSFRCCLVPKKCA